MKEENNTSILHKCVLESSWEELRKSYMILVSLCALLKSSVFLAKVDSNA